MFAAGAQSFRNRPTLNDICCLLQLKFYIFLGGNFFYKRSPGGASSILKKIRRNLSGWGADPALSALKRSVERSVNLWHQLNSSVVFGRPQRRKK